MENRTHDWPPDAGLVVIPVNPRAVPIWFLSDVYYSSLHLSIGLVIEILLRFNYIIVSARPVEAS
jgi:hypothetical protein